MNNEELDKILKEKLKNKIKPTPEAEEKLKLKIEEEKLKFIQDTNKQSKRKSTNYKKLKIITSMAAVVLIVFGIGIFNINNSQIIKTPENNVKMANITEIKPTKMENEVLSSDSEFIIYAKDTNIENVQKSLYIEPALEYDIKKESSDSYKLTFNKNIPDNTIVKLQYVKNQITENSWAYQTSKKLSVNSTYPSNNTYAKKNTVIEIEFSYPSIEELEKNVEITPAVEGTWNHLGKVWRFTPSSELKEMQKYAIKINKGLQAENEILEDEYIFSFTVDSSTNTTDATHNSISVDEIENCKTGEQPQIFYNANSNKVSKIEISKFDTSDEFMEYLKTGNYASAKNIGEYEFTLAKNYIQLTKTLENGYYIASIKNQKNNEMFNCPIQVNNLSAYAIHTERDILVWVAEGESFAKNLNVKYLDKQEKTNENGIAQLKNVLDGSENVKYVKIGDEQQPLIVGVYNYSQTNYATGYIYTDRPLYKNTDTINIWGFIARQLFYDQIDEDAFYIQLNQEEKQKVKIDEDGSFNAKIELKNHIDYENSEITLYYKDSTIANKYITIENYELQNYTYDIIMDKNYGYTGENFEFDVKVQHITGLSVPNKSVVVRYGNSKQYKGTTDENGIAKFSVKLDNNNQSQNLESTQLRFEEIEVINGDLEEYTNAETNVQIYILNNKNIYTNIQRNYDDNKCEITLYKLAQEKNVKVDENLSQLYDGKYDTKVEVKLKETISDKQVTGYIYNEYKKENEPSYKWVESSNTKHIEDISTKDGKIEFDINKLNLKNSTDQRMYSYTLELLYKDQTGKQIKETMSVYNLYPSDADTYVDYGSDESGVHQSNISTNYYAYRYLLKRDISEFSIGDTAKFTLAKADKNEIKEISNEGKLLQIAVQKDIIKTNIINDNNISYTFTDDDFPGCGITAAYFVNGKFYRMPVKYFDFNEEDRNVDVEIVADKQEYKPGETVKLNIKTTNNGKPIPSTVNISVVNKAIFELVEDDTNIIENIYENYYDVYTYSTFRDNLEADSGGGGQQADYIRSNFGDTAYFETVKTNSDGTATVEFKLPDNVTTYRVTVHSANKDLYLGVNTLDIVSKLDFFIQYTEPRNVKTSDDLVLNATSIAEEEYNVTYEFKIEELNKTLKAEAKTNSIATVNFGKLEYGTYNVIINGKYGDKEDTVKYKVNIIESAQEVKDKKVEPITQETTINPSKNPIVLEIYNKKMAQYIEYIDFIEANSNERLDTKIAYNKIQEVKDKYYNTKNTTNYYINIDSYISERYFKNLESGKEDIVLTALISKYANDYYSKINSYYKQNLSNENLFEIYLLAAANNEPVLSDLLYLKAEENITNYNKLLVTLSLEFLGDYQNAKQLYNSIVLTPEENEEYRSLTALINTYINRESAINDINKLIEEEPADEYLRFAILSFFENNSDELEKKETVKIISGDINETIEINGLEVKTYTINNEQLENIKFETDSQNLVVGYYYNTLLDNIDSELISKDMDIKINGKLEKGKTVTLSVNFKNESEGEVRIALPNSLRLAQINGTYDYKKYYLINNKIDYVTFYKTKKCTNMQIPLLVVAEGNYKFENIVNNYNGSYHISNSLDLDIK